MSRLGNKTEPQWLPLTVCAFQRFRWISALFIQNLFNWTHLKGNIPAFIDTVFQVKEAKINMLLYVNSFECIEMDLVLPLLSTISFIYP